MLMDSVGTYSLPLSLVAVGVSTTRYVMNPLVSSSVPSSERSVVYSGALRAATGTQNKRDHS